MKSCQPEEMPGLTDLFVIKIIPINYIKINLILSDNVIQKESGPVLVNSLTDWESFRVLDKHLKK